MPVARLTFALALFTALGSGGAAAQALPAGPQVLTFHSDVDDTEQPYALYLPPGFDDTRRYPLVVSLHGAGSNHRLNLRRVFGRSNAEGENDVEASRYFPAWADVDYIVAAPLARGTMGYQGVAEQDVLAVLADVRRRFPIDPDRTYLTGLSMGGGGALWLGLTRPDVWAAIAPVCPAPPPGTEAFTPNALGLPVRLMQGAADPVVPAEGVRAWAERLAAAGAEVTYTEYPGVGHDSWVPAYADGQVFSWFDGHVRDPHPAHVSFASDRYAYDTAYWVRLDALTPGTLARIDARFAAPDRIEVETEALDGFTLRLAGHPQSTGGLLGVSVDGVAFELAAADSVAFHRAGDAWVEGRAPARGKRPGLEGPMSAAVTGRHVYVYGTADEPSETELAARQAEALKAAEWSVWRGPFLGRVMVFPRVISDREVRPSDVETGALVLFGTAETNGVLAGLRDRLPLHFTGDPARQGLAYVYPVDGRYVLVSSGLPWWEAGADDRFGAAVPALALPARSDFLLFTRGAETPAVEGCFDADWQLPAEAAAALRASGAVTVTDGAE